jgi:hypothetical protein
LSLVHETVQPCRYVTLVKEMAVFSVRQCKHSKCMQNVVGREIKCE